MQRKPFSLLLVAYLSASSCVSSTMILTKPSGSRVFVDGAYIGESPATHSQTVSSSTRNTVRIEAPGFKPTMGVIAADQWNGGRFAFSIVCGVLTLGIGLLGLLWSTDYKPSYDFVLQPDPSMIPGYGAPGGPPGYAPPVPNDDAPPPPPNYQAPPPTAVPAPRGGAAPADPDGLLSP